MKKDKKAYTTIRAETQDYERLRKIKDSFPKKSISWTIRMLMNNYEGK